MRFQKFLSGVLVASVCIAPCARSAAVDIKIGLSAALSGSQAIVGQDQIDGFMLAVEQFGGKFSGRPVTVLKEDDQLKPEIGTQVMRKFIEKDRVDAIVGLGFSNVLMAGLKTIVESGTVALATNAGPSPIAGSSCAANVFSVAWQNDGAAEATGKYVQDKGYKKVFLMAPNYQAGKDMLTGFKRFYKGEIADELYTQVGQADYSAEIAQIQSNKPDAVFVFYPGGMGINFVKQFGQAGLLGKIPLFSIFTIDATTMPSLGTSAEGSIYGAMWDAALDTPENKKFVMDFEAKYKRIPSEYAATAYDAARILESAVRKLNGNITDKKAFAVAVKSAGQSFRSVRGPFRFNTNNLPIQNYYMFQVAKNAGHLGVKEIGVALLDHPDAYFSKCVVK